MVEAIVGPGEAEHEEVVEAVVAPAHADALEALLDKPLAGTLDEAAADGQVLVFEDRVTQMVAVTDQIVGYALDDLAVVGRSMGCIGRLLKLGDDAVHLAVAELVTGAYQPLTRAWQVEAVPDFGGGPELADGVVEVQDAEGTQGSEVVVEEPPQAARAVA